MHADHASDCTACPLDGITIPEEVDGLDRRRFVSRAVAAAAAALLAACGTAGVDAITSPLSGKLTVTLSQYPALATVGGVAVVSSGSSRVAVVRTGQSAFVALSLVCPHEGSTISASSSGFVCPRHGARFDLNGTWTGGQRTNSMRSYATQYDATAGTLTIG